MTDEERDFYLWDLKNLASFLSSPTMGRWEAWLERGRRSEKTIEQLREIVNLCRVLIPDVVAALLCMPYEEFIRNPIRKQIREVVGKIDQARKDGLI